MQRFLSRGSGFHLESIFSLFHVVPGFEASMIVEDELLLPGVSVVALVQEISEPLRFLVLIAAENPTSLAHDRVDDVR